MKLGSDFMVNVNKGIINALYGMTDTKFCSDIFICQACGVYVTIHARHNLWTTIIAYRDNYLYSDTDSIKLITKTTQPTETRLNARRK